MGLFDDADSLDSLIKSSSSSGMETDEQLDEEGVIRYYVRADGEDCPQFSVPKCSNCGAPVDTLDSTDDNTREYRYHVEQGYCRNCGFQVSFDHEMSLESATSLRVHEVKHIDDDELGWMELKGTRKFSGFR